MPSFTIHQPENHQKIWSIYPLVDHTIILKWTADIFPFFYGYVEFAAQPALSV